MMRETILVLEKLILKVKEHLDEKYGTNATEGIVKVTDELPRAYVEYSNNYFWINPIGKFSMFIAYEKEQKEKKERMRILVQALKNTVSPLLKIIISTNERMLTYREGVRPLTDISLVVDTDENNSVCFIIQDIRTEKQYDEQMSQILEITDDLYDAHSNLRAELSKTFKPDNRTSFLIFHAAKQQWDIVNLLFEIGKEKMIDISALKDNRLSKPDMIVKESDIRREITLPNNWQITNSKRGYIMDKPNDIAVYMSIANKALTRAFKKYNELHMNGITENIISDKVSSEILDYFEEIIHAIIMSYTTIECMSNTCIPWGEEYVVESEGVKTLYKKEAIERRFSLKDKLKKVIPQITGIESPVQEDWWQYFVDLENLRNQIIHNKSSTAQDRYSILMDEKIFEIAECHIPVLKHYAKKLRDEKSSIINEFPLGIGFDEIVAFTMSDKSYENFHKGLFNPS